MEKLTAGILLFTLSSKLTALFDDKNASKILMTQVILYRPYANMAAAN